MTHPPLRIAVVARAVMPLHGIGGLERSVHDLVRHLAARGVLVTLITPPPAAGHDAGALDTRGISLRHVPYVTFPFANRRGTTILDRSTAYPLFGLRAGGLAGSLVARGAIDLVHGFGASVLGYARARRRGAPAPLVLNPQGLEEFGATLDRQPWAKRAGYAPLRSAVRAVAAAADRIIATDRSLAPVVARHLAPREGRVVVIPNGIDVVAADRLATAAEGAALRVRHGIPRDERVLLSVGRLEANKGFDVLAGALARSASSGALAGDAWRWVIAGDGPFAPELRQTVAAAGLGRHVHFAGRVSDAELHAWYEAATLFVHPTRYEGSSLVTLEAMAHRRAIVATRAGGLPDKVRPGINGWLAAPGRAGELAAAIDEAFADPARLLAMGARSRRIVDDEFAWPMVAGRHLSLYDELLQRR